jgi:O-Antigen ligase
MYMKTLNQSWTRISSFFQEKQLSFASWMLLLLSGILQFIFSLPHVIALRKLLLLIAFLIAFKYFWEALLKKPKPLLPAVLIFVLLQVWMLVIAGAISNQPFASFSEWKGQWLPAFMSFVVGIGLARTLTLSKLKDPRVAVVMSILIPITIYLCVNAIVIVHDWILAGAFLPSLAGLGDHHGISGYLVALLEPILFADMLSRLVKGNRLLPVPGWVISAILIFAVCTLLATTNRNGILIMLLTFILVTAMMISEIRKVYSPKKIIAFVLSTLVFILAIAFVSYKIDPRWQNFIETVPIAWNIDHDLLWLNGDDASVVPLTPSGKQVDISEYSRIAWAHEGWRMLMAHPWGMEIARDTFHKLELAKYGHAGMAHSHNSWIDFGLEVGIPGLLLWGWILLLLAQFGWRTWRTHKEPLGLALAVLVIMFAVRGLLDSIFRDHEIEQFMLVAGLLFGALSFGKTNIPQARF